jgi:hypothetical protein
MDIGYIIIVHLATPTYSSAASALAACYCKLPSLNKAWPLAPLLLKRVSKTLISVIPLVRHVTGNDKDYLRKIPRVVW